MAEIRQVRVSDRPEPNGISLKGLYAIAATATAIGVLVVFLLNVATPMDFIRARFGELTQQTGVPLVLAIIKRLLILFVAITAVSSLGVAAMHQMLRPIAGCLRLLKAGEAQKHIRQVCDAGDTR